MKALNIALVSALALSTFACSNAPTEEKAPEAVKVEVENLPSTIVVKVDENGERTTFQLQDESFNNISEDAFNAYSEEEKEALIANLTAQSLDVVASKDSVSDAQVALAADEIDELQGSKVSFFAYGAGFRYGYYSNLDMDLSDIELLYTTALASAAATDSAMALATDLDMQDQLITSTDQTLTMDSATAMVTDSVADSVADSDTKKQEVNPARLMSAGFFVSIVFQLCMSLLICSVYSAISIFFLATPLLIAAFATAGATSTSNLLSTGLGIR